MPNKEEHSFDNWLLKKKTAISGLNLNKELVECYKCTFTCQECGNKYTRMAYREEEFDQMKVGETVWAYGWNNGALT